jgi:hypothetical protein
VVVLQRNREKRLELERAHREQMSPIYRQLVETLKDFDAFAAKPEAEQQAFFKELTTKLVIHGPTPVVVAYNVWQRAVTPVTPATFLAWEGVLRAIREDLGHDNSALARGDLLRLWVREDDDEESRALWKAIKGEA